MEVTEYVPIQKDRSCVPVTRTSLEGDVNMKKGVLPTHVKELVRGKDTMEYVIRLTFPLL